MTSKLKSVEKNEGKQLHVIIFMFGSKTNKFGRVWTEKLESDKEVQKGKKRLFAFLNFLSNQNSKRVSKKNAINEGHPCPSSFLAIICL